MQLRKMMATKKKTASSMKNPLMSSTEPLAEDSIQGAEHRQLVAASLTDGLLLNAVTAVYWSSSRDGSKKAEAIRTTGKALEAAGARVRAGDLGAVESLLMAQAVALNAMFSSFAQMAHQTDFVDHLERFTRLGLRAQSQCAHTLEILAALKTPTVIAKQANVAMTQQVVNGPVQQVARADLSNTAQNKLIGEPNVELGRMDTRAARRSAGGNSPLEAMAIEHRAAHARGQGSRGPECE